MGNLVPNFSWYIPLNMAALRSPVIRAIILGAPASGKGTISSRIVRDFKMKHLSGGDLLRSQIKAKTHLGLQAKQYVTVVISLDVPDEEIVQRVQGRLTHLASGRVYNTDFNPPKVAGVDDLTGEPLVQREDDRPEAVRKRLQSYHSNILPILDFYDNRGKLQLFKGRFTNEIWPSVHDFLTKLKTSMV